MGRGLTDLGDRVRFLARPEVVPENHPIPLNTRPRKRPQLLDVAP